MKTQEQNERNAYHFLHFRVTINSETVQTAKPLSSFTRLSLLVFWYQNKTLWSYRLTW